MNKPSRVWRFASATEALLRRRKLNVEILQVWCGHYTALCGITYPLESVIWKSMRVHEKWRFISMPEELKQLAKNQDVESFSNMLSELLAPIYENDTGDPRDALTAARLPQAATLSTSYAEYVIESLREGSWLQTSAARAQLHAKPSKRFDLEIPALVEPLDERLADETQYRLLWARRWKYSDKNIRIKEGRVVLSSLKRSARVASLHGQRKLTISDNLGVVCAFSKGRSGQHKLNRLCRQACALQFATGIIWSLRHVETKRNVADKPS